MNESTQGRTITVLCVDDHAIVREGLVSLIEGDPDLKVAGEAASAQEAIEAFRTIKPDVTVIDLRLPDGDGLDVIKELRRDFPQARFVVLTSSEGDMDMRRAIEAGAQAFLIKGVVRKELRQIIKTVHAGDGTFPRRSPRKSPIISIRQHRPCASWRFSNSLVRVCAIKRLPGSFRSVRTRSKCTCGM